MEKKRTQASGKAQGLAYSLLAAGEFRSDPTEGAGSSGGALPPMVEAQFPADGSGDNSKDESDSGEEAVNDYGIRYATGQVIFDQVDLESEGFGMEWGHTRSYTNGLRNNAGSANGNGWFVKARTLVQAYRAASAHSSPTPIVTPIINKRFWRSSKTSLRRAAARIPELQCLAITRRWVGILRLSVLRAGWYPRLVIFTQDYDIASPGFCADHLAITDGHSAVGEYLGTAIVLFVCCRLSILVVGAISVDVTIGFKEDAVAIIFFDHAGEAFAVDSSENLHSGQKSLMYPTFQRILGEKTR